MSDVGWLALKSLDDLAPIGEELDFLAEVIEATPDCSHREEDRPAIDGITYKERIKELAEQSSSLLSEAERKEIFPPLGIPNRDNLILGRFVSTVIEGAEAERAELLASAAYWAGTKGLTPINKRTWGLDICFYENVNCSSCGAAVSLPFSRISRKTLANACLVCGHHWGIRCHCLSCRRKSAASFEHTQLFIHAVDNLINAISLDVVKKFSQNAAEEANSCVNEIVQAEKKMYLSFVKNKFRLSAEERNFIQCCKNYPNFLSNQHDAIIEISEVISRSQCHLMSSLVTHGVLVENIKYQAMSSEKILANLKRELLDSYNLQFFNHDYGRKRWRNGTLYTYTPSENDIIEIFHVSRIDGIDVSVLTSTTTYRVNPFFFKEILGKTASSGLREQEGIKSIFGSPHEKNQFSELVAEHPGKIVLPNYPISVFVDFSNKKLKSSFSEEDLGYLKRARVDYLVTNMSGEPESVIELQIGRHHYKKQYKERDNLKIKLFEICGIPMIEEFGRAHANYFKDDLVKQDLFDASHQVEEYGDF